ncbi:hypothetical protein SEPCBS119000_000639 [Sporothrix epigloea]|uniref:Uncharacterized protein n=1 Tax=Sporothrix epigloea TaxID=1892477 RepID=A0ABP0D6C3_9PEZI
MSAVWSVSGQHYPALSKGWLFLASGSSSSWTAAFCILFVWRYLRQVVHLIAFWMYRPAEPLPHPTITSADVTVIIPTIDPHNQHFQAGLTSACRNLPRRVVVVTAGEPLRLETIRVCAAVAIDVLAAPAANKRVQVVTGAQAASGTRILALMDDHVLWKDTFLQYALPAFERDPTVGIVGTNKRVIRDERHDSLRHRVLNMIQCLYLERHNFEIRSSNAVDGGVFVVSGRTSLLRSCIMTDPLFVQGFLNETLFGGRVGPLAVDDDNFITRWCIARGWRVKIQYRDETLITTSLGSAYKFSGGLIRWVRTTWRSNTVSLLSWHVWATQPWSVYAVYMSLFTNFAMIYDPLLLYAFAQSDLCGYGSSSAGQHESLFRSLLPLICWMLAFKMVKPFAFFWRHPQDLLILPAYFAFTWMHSLIKLKGLLTCYNVKWEGRNLAALNADLVASQAARRASVSSTEALPMLDPLPTTTTTTTSRPNGLLAWSKTNPLFTTSTEKRMRFR